MLCGQLEISCILSLSRRYCMCGVGTLRTIAVHQEVLKDVVELMWASPSTRAQLPALFGSRQKKHSLNA